MRRGDLFGRSQTDVRAVGHLSWDANMVRLPRVLAASLCIACTLFPTAARAAEARNHPSPPLPPAQETGFLNRKVELNGASYRFQIYVPEEFRRDEHKPWPILLFLHGRGERGSEGMFQTQIGLPLAVRDHPERWPFIIVMPQCLDRKSVV